MVGVEYLTNVDRMPQGAYFLFAAVKIRGGHGGHGRAITVLTRGGITLRTLKGIGRCQRNVRGSWWRSS